MQTLFDKNGMQNISDLVINNPSFKTIMEDGIVTNARDYPILISFQVRKRRT